ncbi:MAG: hypothetical protein ACI9JL_000983 [Paracoccaceae bacterium]|jgi:hypothetical protein
MNSYENLNERVENAVQKFHQSEELRRRENKSLSGILNDLEIKFEARTAELQDCQVRINELEESNVSLNALVCQLVDIVEKSADDITQDPLYRASAAASDIVNRYVAQEPVYPVAGPPTEQEAATAPGPEQGPPTATAEEVLSEGNFENIAEEFLLAEELFEKTEGAAKFPKLVFDAMAIARGDDVSPTVDAPSQESTGNSVSEAATETRETPQNDGDLDIKEIMARLEIAAERAQLRADEDERRDRSTLEPEVLDRAVGGRA